MRWIIDWKGKAYMVDSTAPLDISLPLRSGSENPNAFYIPAPLFEPIRVGSFVGSVQEGGSANCENLHLNAHGNGTHTECVGHISKERITINQCLKQFHFVAAVVSVEPKAAANGDMMVGLDAIQPILTAGVEALVIRTLPNTEAKKTFQYSGNNPTYLSTELLQLLAEEGINHLLVDLPSVDREEDEGKLSGHHAYWHYPENPRMNATITELIYVPDSVPDGIYLLNLQIASLETDATPSKPVLYRLESVVRADKSPL